MLAVAISAKMGDESDGIAEPIRRRQVILDGIVAQEVEFMVGEHLLRLAIGHLDLASAEIRRLSEHRSHWMQQTELEQEARRREAHGRSRREAEAGQLRKDLAKARRCAAALQEQLQALQSKFETAVLTARPYASMAFGSLSERLGTEAGKAALESDPECPDWLWD